MTENDKNKAFNDFNKACVELKAVILKELVDPWAIPILNWINKVLIKINKWLKS